jgi:hypothetical protein
LGTIDRTAWAILNATADDAENLEQIYRQVSFELLPAAPGGSSATYCYRPVAGAPLLHEIAEGVRQLVGRGLLEVARDESDGPPPEAGDLSYVWRAWFRMTPAGRRVWESSEPAVEQEHLT